MKNSNSEKESGGPLRTVWQELRLIYRLLLDPEVSVFLKLMPFFSLVYLIVPVDFIPDMLVGFGQLDDLAVLLGFARAFVNLAPAPIVARHRAEILAEDGYDALETKAPEDKELDDSIKLG